jgi:cleavage and polyadenylation specificity factor subunit 2
LALNRHLRFYDSVAALTATYPASRPKLILAIPPSLSHGPSRTLFTQLASNDHTLVVLTERGKPGTLSHDLFQAWNARQSTGQKAGEGSAGRPLEMNDRFQIKARSSRIPLHSPSSLT